MSLLTTAHLCAISDAIALLEGLDNLMYDDGHTRGVVIGLEKLEASNGTIFDIDLALDELSEPALRNLLLIVQANLDERNKRGRIGAS